MPERGSVETSAAGKTQNQPHSLEAFGYLTAREAGRKTPFVPDFRSF